MAQSNGSQKGRTKRFDLESGIGERGTEETTIRAAVIFSLRSIHFCISDKLAGSPENDVFNEESVI